MDGRSVGGGDLKAHSHFFRLLPVIRSSIHEAEEDTPARPILFTSVSISALHGPIEQEEVCLLFRITIIADGQKAINLNAIPIKL